MSYSQDNVKRMIQVMPNHYALARYALVVIDAMRGRKQAIAYDNKELADFVEYCASCWNEAQDPVNHIDHNNLWDLILDQLKYEASQDNLIDVIRR